MAVAQRAAQLRVGRDMGVAASWRRRRHGLLATFGHGDRLRRTHSQVAKRIARVLWNDPGDRRDAPRRSGLRHRARTAHGRTSSICRGFCDAPSPRIRRMRRRLHRTRAVAGVEHLAEQPLEVDRLRRRPPHAAPLAADARARPCRAARAGGRGGEDRVEQERRRRLPARARHAGDLQRLRRPPEELVGGDGHRGAGVGDDELRDVDRRRGARRRARQRRSRSPRRRSRARRRVRRGRRRRLRPASRAARRRRGRAPRPEPGQRPRPPRARRRGAPDPSSPGGTSGHGGEFRLALPSENRAAQGRRARS